MAAGCEPGRNLVADDETSGEPMAQTCGIRKRRVGEQAIRTALLGGGQRADTAGLRVAAGLLVYDLLHDGGDDAEATALARSELRDAVTELVECRGEQAQLPDLVVLERHLAEERDASGDQLLVEWSVLDRTEEPIDRHTVPQLQPVGAGLIVPTRGERGACARIVGPREQVADRGAALDGKRAEQLTREAVVLVDGVRGRVRGTRMTGATAVARVAMVEWVVTSADTPIG